MLYIDIKYIGLLSGRLDRFKRKSNNTYNCRCPICGDSKTNRVKTRGYLYEKKGSMLYFCHNCGASLSFANFLKSLDPELYKEYTQEKFIETYGKSNTSTTTVADITNPAPPKFMRFSPLGKLKKISQLEYNHPAKLYVEKRKIPSNVHYKLFYAPKFKEWVNTFIPGKFDYEVDEPRLILPFLDEEKNCFGFQGRSFTPGGIRYITIMIDSDKPKIFGLDTLNTQSNVYVTEGPIDSLFLPNAIAMAGADMQTSWFNESVLSKLVFVYDNEPRNPDIIRRMSKVIDKGHKIVIWDDGMKEKDINDMVISGIDVKSTVDKCTYTGLEAQLKFAMWKKI